MIQTKIKKQILNKNITGKYPKKIGIKPIFSQIPRLNDRKLLFKSLNLLLLLLNAISSLSN